MTPSRWQARIQELSRRITNAATRKATEEVAITKELILRELWENAQRGAQVHGGSAVTNRALELLGKELGLFREPEDELPVNLEDLPPETLDRMLAQAEAEQSLWLLIRDQSPCPE